MKKLALIFLIAISFSSISAGAQLEFSISPDFSLFSGQSDYSLILRGTEVDSATFTLISRTVESLLEFPMGSKSIGVDIKVNQRDVRDKWYLKISAKKSLTNPSEKMTDSDWDEASPFYGKTLFSYTESKVELDMINIKAEAGFKIARINRVTMMLVLAFNYIKMEQEIIGFTGWQRILNDTTHVWSDPINFSSDLTAMTYELTVKQPSIGLLLDYDITGRFSTGFGGSFVMTFYSDRDDHVLRNKLSTSDGDGTGFKLDGYLNYQLTDNPDKLNYFIRLGANYISTDPRGSQKQEWYDDESYYDPDTGQDVIWVEKGTVYGGIPHHVNISLTTINIGIGVSF